MFKITGEVPALQMHSYFAPAVILESYINERKVLLKIKKNGEELIASGLLALPNIAKLNPGDTVLAAGENLDSLYIIGILDCNIKSSENLTLEDGTYARKKDKRKIQIFSKSSELIFEYDSVSNTSKVNVQHGNLEFTAEEGSINFISNNGINLKSSQSIELQSSAGIKLSLIESIAKILPLVHLRKGELKMNGSKINITSARADFHIEDFKYLGSKFSATLKYGKLIIGKIETTANDIFCKAKNIYNTVDELTQIKTKRMRTLIKSSLHLKSKNSYLKSDEDFKINAKKIHLG